MKRLIAVLILIAGYFVAHFKAEESRVVRGPVPQGKGRSLASTTPNPTATPQSSDKIPVRKIAAATDKELALRTIRQLQRCYDSRTCPYDDSDPRAYELALGRDLASHLRSFHRDFKQDQKLITSLAKEFIQSGDGFVQEEALRMFAELPTSADNLDAITQNLASTPDPSLIKQALPEMQRYLGSPLEPKVHAFLSGTLATGAHFASETVSESITPFLTPKSLPTYQKTLNTLPPNARAAHNLGSALREYRRLQTGA